LRETGQSKGSAAGPGEQRAEAAKSGREGEKRLGWPAGQAGYWAESTKEARSWARREFI